MIHTSSPRESTKDALTGGTIAGGITLGHQFLVGAEIEQILSATGGQFTLTSLNGFIVLRCYNFFKIYLATNFSKLDLKVVVGISAFLTSIETLIVTYGIQKYGTGSKSPESLAFFMQGFSFFSLGIIYESILKARKE